MYHINMYDIYINVSCVENSCTDGEYTAIPILSATKSEVTHDRPYPYYMFV